MFEAPGYGTCGNQIFLHSKRIGIEPLKQFASGFHGNQTALGYVAMGITPAFICCYLRSMIRIVLVAIINKQGLNPGLRQTQTRYVNIRIMIKIVRQRGLPIAMRP